MRIPAAGYRKFTAFLKEIDRHLEKRVRIRKMDKIEGKVVPQEAFLPILK
jgi:hypothetical protein